MCLSIWPSALLRLASPALAHARLSSAGSAVPHRHPGAAGCHARGSSPRAVATLLPLFGRGRGLSGQLLTCVGWCWEIWKLSQNKY